MNFIETLLSESLKEKRNQLDLEGSDRKVLQIACEDLMNYLKVQWGLTGEEAAQYKLINKLEEYFHEELEELREFISVWSGLWLKKWEERVRVLIGKRNDARWKRMHKLKRNAQPLWNELRHKNEIKEIITETLVRNGEICGTSILAENLLKFELNDYAKNKMNISKPEPLLNLVNNTLRRARDVSRSRGALIFLRISKSFFQFAK
ncbi:MAG: hypothetical protein U9O89_06275 [Thermoproteota archaeon]|nr:hypothetical protein [Thermoproteota archaeon]